VVLVSPVQEIVSLSFKLEFETTNNVALYEALILGLRAAKDTGIAEISVFGDVDFIAQQIRNIYQDKL
jgi:ribonuclease HI